jgi:hypothetical protein
MEDAVLKAILAIKNRFSYKYCKRYFMNQLKKLVENANEQILVEQEQFVMEGVEYLKDYVMDLNEAFNADFITEEEYYQLLENAFFDKVKGTVNKITGAGQTGIAGTTHRISNEPGKTKVQSISDRRQENAGIDNLVSRASAVLKDPHATQQQKQTAQATIQKWNSRRRDTETGRQIGVA